MGNDNLKDSYCRADVELIAKKSSERAVMDVLQKLGIDTSDPHEIQRDMLHLRQQRVVAQRVSVFIKITIIGSFITGGLATLWIGVKQTLNS